MQLCVLARAIFSENCCPQRRKGKFISYYLLFDQFSCENENIDFEIFPHPIQNDQLVFKDEDGRRTGGRRSKVCSSSGGGTGPPSGLGSAGVDHLGNDGESSSGWSPKSRDEDSRASSIEKEVGNINLSSDLSNCNSGLQTPSGKVKTVMYFWLSYYFSLNIQMVGLTSYLII